MKEMTTTKNTRTITVHLRDFDFGKEIIFERDIEFTPCTAIAASIGDTTRQKAVFVHDTTDIFHDGDGVLFDIDVPETEEEAISALQEFLDGAEETLDTIEWVEE